MKLFNTVLLGGLALLFSNSGAFAQGSVANFSLNQANQQISLDEKDFETIYRSEQVAETCYRDETRGTRRECHNDTRRECRYEPQRVCENVRRNVCSPVQQCTTRTDRVCNSHGCTNVPRRSCQTVNQCSSRVDQVCHTANRQVCANVPIQVCNNVPVIVRVPYGCTRTVQVPAGQQLRLHTIARVNVQFASLNEVGPTPDVFQAVLNKGHVSFNLQNRSAYLYQVIHQERSEQMISSNEKIVNYQFVIKAVSIQKLNEFVNSQIVNPKLYTDRVAFSLLGRLDVPVKGHLKIVKNRRLLADIIVVDADFATRALVTQGNVSQLMLSNVGIRNIEYKSHGVELSLNLDIAALQQGLINADALAQISNRAVEVRFESFPN